MCSKNGENRKVSHRKASFKESCRAYYDRLIDTESPQVSLGLLLLRKGEQWTSPTEVDGGDFVF